MALVRLYDFTTDYGNKTPIDDRKIEAEFDQLISVLTGGTSADKLVVDDIILDDSLIYINDSANAKMTKGLTINQGAEDDEIFSLKSSDIAHGMTDETETDTFCLIKKLAGATGGVRLKGFLDSGAEAMTIEGLAITPNTGKAANQYGVINLAASKKSGTTVASVGTNGNLVSIADEATVRFIFDAEGDSWQTGNIGLNTSNFGTGTPTQVIAIANGTPPTSEIVNQIVIYSKDAVGGNAGATLSLAIEGDPVVHGAGGAYAQSHKVPIWINEVEYFLLLDAV